MENFGAWLDANPLSVLAFVIVILVMTSKSFFKTQGNTLSELIQNITRLAESTVRNSDNVNQLTALYEKTLLDVAKSVFKQEHKQKDILAELKELKSMLNIAINKCERCNVTGKETTNGNTNTVA